LHNIYLQLMRDTYKNQE